MQEPQFESGIPRKPEWFDTYASEEWDRFTSDLNGQRVLPKNDLGILVSICVAYEQLRETRAIIKTLGRSYTVEDMGGNTHYKARPECGRFETAQMEYGPCFPRSVSRHRVEVKSRRYLSPRSQRAQRNFSRHKE